MSELLAGLDKLGFSNLSAVKLFEEEKMRETSKPVAETQTKELDCLFLKEFECPVCDKTFKQHIVRKTKIRLLSSEVDLKPNYEPIDPLNYDAILCPHCGYAALTMFFSQISDKAASLILQTVTPQFKNKEYPIILNYGDAIEKYKLALYNAIVKKAKNSEKAYICMKIAWLYRTGGDLVNEKLFLNNAVSGFVKAYSTEVFPMCGLDACTLQYIMAALYMLTGNLDEALKWVGDLIVSRAANDRLKQRAFDLKQNIMSRRKAVKP